MAVQRGLSLQSGCSAELRRAEPALVFRERAHERVAQIGREVGGFRLGRLVALFLVEAFALEPRAAALHEEKFLQLVRFLRLGLVLLLLGDLAPHDEQ